LNKNSIAEETEGWIKADAIKELMSLIFIIWLNLFVRIYVDVYIAKIFSKKNN
jgi:hypothetical protein